MAIKSYTLDDNQLSVVQIAIASVQENIHTQCDYVIVGLDRWGSVWEKDNRRCEWRRVSMEKQVVKQTNDERT
jgi:hypothetical protein